MRVLFVCIKESLTEYMSTSFKRYEEFLPERVSIKRKVTEKTEKKNFHLHEQLEIVFALSGNLKVQFEDRIVSIPKYSLLLLDSMNLHYILSEEGSGICDRYVLYFAPDYISDLSTPEVNLLECFLMRKDDRCVLLKADEEVLEDLFYLLDRMEKQFCRLESNIEDYSGSLNLKLLLGQFLLLTNQLYNCQYGRQLSRSYREYAAIATGICEYIKGNYHLNLTAEDLSHEFSISRTTLYNMFKNVLGITVNEYITDCRITKAKDLLINSSYSIEIISDMVGCSSISSFSRLFKAQTDMSPLKYRKKYE